MLAILVIAAVSLAVWFTLGVRRGQRDATPKPRAGSGAADDSDEWRSPPGYVGSAACRRCHEEQYASYAESTHSRALSEIRPDDEPPDSFFDHPESGFRFRTSRENGRMVHEASLLLADGSKFGGTRHDLTYKLGSGHVSRTYLVVENGLFLESPITWWESWRRWDLSPGYENHANPVFNRVVEDGCLFCHSGIVETSTANDFRMRLRELPIGCERCHGPGEAHVAEQTAGRSAAGAGDRSIVHPGHLPRALAEAICQQCHKQGDFSIPARGIVAAEFRPGEPLEKYRHDYRIRRTRSASDIVEHSEQLEQSACYRKSESMTCTTCHNPHTIVAPADRAAHYRSICLTCHQDQACRVASVNRTEQNQNDCVKCHMPVNDTIMPHVAFTQHRIGVHPKKPDSLLPDPLDRVVPLFDIAILSDADRQRSLGLAWETLALIDFNDGKNPRHTRQSFDRADDLLSTLPIEFVDATVLAARSELFYLRGDLPHAAELGLEVLRMESAGPRAKVKVLLPLGFAAASEGRIPEAARHFGELARLRRTPDDWLFLGRYEHELRHDDAAISALKTALRLDLSSIPVRELLAQIYHARQEFDSEKRLRNEIERLSRKNPEPR